MAFFNNYADAKNSVEATEAYFERFKRLFLDNISLKLKEHNYNASSCGSSGTMRIITRDPYHELRRNGPTLTKDEFFNDWEIWKSIKNSSEGRAYALGCQLKYRLEVRREEFSTIERSFHDLEEMINRAAKECIRYKDSFLKDEYEANQLLQRIVKIQTQSQNAIEWFNFLDKRLV